MDDEPETTDHQPGEEQRPHPKIGNAGRPKEDQEEADEPAGKGPGDKPAADVFKVRSLPFSPNQA